MLSSTYQLSTAFHEANANIDGDNRYLWRMSRRRLDVEAWRDALLHVAGSLDPALGGPSTKLADTNNHRRTIYAMVSRHELDSLLRLFDFPDANITSEKRSETTVPQQQLFVLNSPFMLGQAKAFSARVQREAGAGEEARIQHAFQLAYSRSASDGRAETWPGVPRQQSRRTNSALPLGTLCASVTEQQRIHVSGLGIEKPMNPSQHPNISRRESLHRMGTGLGVLGLAGILAQDGTLAHAADQASNNPLASKLGHFAPRAKHIIHLFMNGGPSQVDTFDPKPALEKYNGQRPPNAELKTERKTGGLMMSPFKFQKYGESGIEVSDLFPQVGSCIDDICVIRSMHTNIPNHEPSLLMMNSGETQPTRPALGSWLLYGLGTENQNLPGFVVLCPGKPVVGPQLWSNRFPARYLSGNTHQQLRDGPSQSHSTHQQHQPYKNRATRTA